MVEAVKHRTQIPTFIKLPANTHIQNLLNIASTAEQSGVDALVVINTLPGMVINVETRRPILGHYFGGLSGPAIKPVGVRLVYELFQSTSLPIIGVGGISNWKDAIEYIMAGAKAVQIGTALAKLDLHIFKELVDGIQQYLNLEGISKLSDLVGVASQ